MTDFELYEQYMDGALTAAEKALFEKRLQEDAAFAREFDQYSRVMNAGMEEWEQWEPEREALKVTLQKITAQRAKPSKLFLLRRYTSAAAAILVIMLAGWWLFNTPQEDRNQKTYARFIANEKISLTSRGTRGDSLQNQAAAYIYDEKYKEAGVILQQVVNSGADSLQEALVYLGYCYLRNGQYKEAEAIFSRTDLPKGVIAERARWYLALLYLKTGRKQLCKEVATGIAASGGAYKQKATDLLQAL